MATTSIPVNVIVVVDIDSNSKCGHFAHKSLAESVGDVMTCVFKVETYISLNGDYYRHCLK